MQNLFLNTSDLEVGQTFSYKGSNHLIIGLKDDGLFILDLDYDTEFTSIENPIYFISYVTLEEDLLTYGEIDLNLFTSEAPMEFIQD